MNTPAQEAIAHVVSPAQAEILGFDTAGYLPTNDEINSQLFGERPPLDLPPLPQKRLAEAAPVKPEAPQLLNTKKLVNEIVAEAVALRESGEADGMHRPRGVVLGGLPYGETPEHLLDTVLEYADTGVVPGPYGDTTSYLFGSILPRYVEAGIQPVVYVGKEVAEHPDTLAILKKLGLSPEDTFAQGHNLGGVLDDLAQPVVARRSLMRRVAEYQNVRDALVSRRGTEGFSEADIVAEIGNIDDDLVLLSEQKARIEQVIDDRLAEEDAKIKAATEHEIANDETDSVINMMPTFTRDGGTAIRTESYTDNTKDIDGLSLGRPRDARRWDEITSNALLRTAEFFAGKPVAKIRHLMRLVGRGALVGKRAAELAELEDDAVIDGRSKITSWAENPGKDPIGVLLLAVPAAELIKADRIVPARWGRGLLGLFQARRLLIIDAGVASVTNPVTGKRETRGNLDLASLPAARSRRNVLIEATGPRGGVGPVTGALAAKRTVECARERFYTAQDTDQELDEVLTRGERELADARA
ncbi:MAG TPA: hypothetical protein VLH86_05275 [Patescibacteria group bacterium]|nr:hypothetical protein [Patescibacteria group bacterium]